MKLFSNSQIQKINQVAMKSKKTTTMPKKFNKHVTNDLQRISIEVSEYFKDSKAILISSKSQLHDYVSNAIQCGYAGIDVETTGLDRIHDRIVGASLYYPGDEECYIPINHLVPIFDQPYKGQLSYEEVADEFSRLAKSDIKLILANADFDLSMIFKDMGVDLCDSCYYDVILAWRCLKEDELHNRLKELVSKYVLKGRQDPKKFNDFFTPELFQYCKPQIAKLYAGYDARITFDLFKWQLPYCTETHEKCKRNNLQAISQLIWNVEFPLIKTCQYMHRYGIYIDKDIAQTLQQRYHNKRDAEMNKLREMVQEIIDNSVYNTSAKQPFYSGKDFNPVSPVHVKYLLYTLMKVPTDKHNNKEGTGKDVLNDMNLPVTDQILKVRSLNVLINTFIDKLPNSTTEDSRIHAQFKQIGAATGRFSSAEPNLQNIPSHAVDIRHMFTASPGYVMMSSDYSQQEPKITAYVSQDPDMINAFMHGRDIYATIASVAFNVPYENCLEFHPETHEYQPDGKKRRSEAKTILLGVTYGRSIPSIADQLYGKNKNMTEKEKTKEAQKVYDSVMKGFPALRKAMINAQNQAKKLGYTTTILGRRRHIPNMQLPEFEFKAMPGYVNPDIDPLDPSTLVNKSDIPDRIQKSLLKEFKSFKYFGQIVKRTKQLAEKKIRVINNTSKINEASRKCLNSVIQGSAADMTKLAMLKIQNSEEWKQLGGRILIPVHDELICEFPVENYKRGAELLSELMSSAGDFLPFPITCDVEIIRRWYGLEYPCKYSKPTSLVNLSEDEIKWVQYMLYEREYELPLHKDKFKDEFRGDIAKGVDGVWSDKLSSYIQDYKSKYHLNSDIEFIDHIDSLVNNGTI